MPTPSDQEPNEKNIGDKHWRNTVGRNNGQHDDSGESPEQREAEAADLEKPHNPLGGEAGNSSKGKAINPSDLNKAEKDSGQDGASLYREEPGKPGRRRFRMTKRQAIAGGATGILVGGLFSVFSIIQGPLQIIHFAQLLQKFHFSNNEDFMDGRAGRYLRHVFSGSAERARLGFVRDKIASRVELRLQTNSGVRSIYSDPPGRRLIGYEVIDEVKARPFIEDMDREGVNTRGAPRGSGTGNNTGPPDPNNRFIDLEVDSSGKDIRDRRKVTRAAVKSTGHYKVASRYASRLLIKRGGVDFHPLKNRKRQAGERLVDYYDRQKKERSERHKRGADPPNKRLVGDERDTDGDGKNDTNTNDQANQGNELLDEAADAEAPSARKNLAARLVGGFAAQAVVGAICFVNDVGNGIDEHNYDNTLVAMRIGMGIVTTGNQSMSNIDTNIDELGSISTDLYDEEADPGEESWAAARSIQYENGQELTGPDLNEESKPGRTGKPPLFEAVGTIPLVNEACGLAEQAEKIPILGGVVKLANEIGARGIDAVLGLANTSAEEVFDSIIRTIAGESINTYAKGAELGNIANYGSMLAANDQAIAMGGRALEDGEVQELDRLARAEDRREFASLGFYDRVLNVYRVESVAATLAMNAPKSPQQAAQAIVSLPGNMFSKLASFGSSLVGATSHNNRLGEERTYDYGFPEFGFSLAEQEDERFENPFENAEIMEANNNQRLREANEKYNECFSMKVDPETGNLSNGEAARYEEIESNPNCADGSEDWSRFRFYLADLIAAHTLACDEGIETSCTQVGFGNTPVVQGDPGSGPAPSGDTQSLAQQILDNPNITYPLDATSPNGSTKEVLQALAKGQPAPVYCTGGRPGNRTTTSMNPNVLKFVLEYGQQAKVGVNSLTDKCHSKNSQHYVGNAVDFECNAVPFEVRRGDPIAAKYGGKRNGETCSANSHWHYNFSP